MSPAAKTTKAEDDAAKQLADALARAEAAEARAADAEKRSDDTEQRALDAEREAAEALAETARFRRQQERAVAEANAGRPLPAFEIVTRDGDTLAELEKHHKLPEGSLLATNGAVLDDEARARGLGDSERGRHVFAGTTLNVFT